MTTELEQRIEKLSPEQRSAFKKQLAQKLKSIDSLKLNRLARDGTSVPLSPQQRRLWTLTQFAPDSTAYNIPGVLSLEGVVNEQLLKEAIAHVAGQQRMLKTVIRLDGEFPTQVYVPEMGIPFEVHEVHGNIDDSIRDAINVKFDLSNGPLWRAELKRIRDDYSILVLSFHHIIFDGWSLGLFVSGLFRAYSQLLGAEELDVYDLDVQFDDYSRWQVSQLDAIRAKDSAFWRDRLRDAPPALDLFSEGRRPKNELRVGAMQSASISRDTFEKARLLAREHGTTPFNFFQSVLRALIYRYTNLSDLVIGTPVSGRDLAETHQLIGLFVNTLPVRVQFDPSASFVDLLKRCRDESASTFEHGDLPFDTIVEVVNPERTPGCNPLFQLLYTYQNKIPALELSALTVRYESVDIGTSKFDLSLDVFEDVDGLACLFEYDTQIYSPEQISSLATHFSNLVCAVVEFPETPINKLSFLSESDLKKALTYTNRVTCYGGLGTFTEAFRGQVSRTPNAPCVVDLGFVKSYIDVESSADRIAAVLCNLGVRRGTVVGLCLERSSNLIETVVAVLHVGAAFVVLDPSYPEERLKFMIQDSGSSVVVAREESAVTLQNAGAHVIGFEQLLKESNTISNESIRIYRCDTERVARPSDDAYLVYTSGTTGTPKAVSISHSSWMNALFGWNKEYELSTRARRHLQMASPGFDVFCGDVVRSLGTGGCLVICPRTIMSEPSELFELITSAQITIAEFVPAVFRNFANWLKQTKKRLEHLAVVIVASDAWYYREYREFVEILGEHTRLVNSYGLAEATIDSTWFDEKFHKRNSPLNENSGVPIGTPFPNVEVVILDENENLMPPGVPGEICIGGWGLAKGYRNRPELTAQKFIPNPFGKDGSSRLYKTGDIGVLCADGIIELRGRRDQQVKIRGQRIELGEIESALVTFEGVVGAVASVHENNGANQSIAAYYVKRDKDTTIDIGRLRCHLEKCLPGYMVPGQYLEIAEIPRTTNGKVNRKALPKPASDTGSLTTFVSPTTLVQEQLASIWCQVLSQPRVGVRDSFFELGGHSLLAFQVIGRIKRVFGVELPIHTLFSAPSILEIEKVILSLQGVQRTATSLIEDYPIIAPDREHRYEPFPLTEVQQAYWLGRNDVFEFGNVTTHSYDELETELIDVEKFEGAWNKVIKRHDMLRAVVREDGTQQVLKEISEYSMPVIDLRDSSDVEVQSRISAIRNEMSHQKLDVSRWPVFDIRISLLPQSKARIHFSTDALIWDAWSFATLIHDLVCFYVGETNNLRPLDVTFRDYVLAEKDLMQGEKYKRAVAYWKERISELPPAPALPMAKDPSHLESPRFTRLHRAMDPSRWDRLKLKATKRGMTATGVTLAAYAEVLAKYSQDPRFSLNLTFLNRHPLHPHVNDVVGEFTSLTLLAVDNNDGTTFVERARKIQSNLWHDLEHHAISGVQVLRELGKRSGDATRARMPVVFTSALVVPIPERHPELPMVPVYRDGVTQTSQVWLDCGVWEDQSWLLCNWDVVLELYPNGFAEEMFEAYWNLLVRLADEDTLWDSEVVSRSTFDALDDNRESCEPRRGNTLVSLFLEQAKSRPDALAVVDRLTELTYLELLGHVAWIQRELLRCGINRGEIVAIFMHKGWEQVAATLGAMSAGAVYVPIDPELPVERIQYLLAKCKVRHALTQPCHCQLLAVYSEINVHIIESRSRATTSALTEEALPTSSDTAYVIFTSGSTGKPKGVVIDHSGAVNTILDINDRFGVGANDSALAVSALSFDLSVYDIFGMLAAGGRIVVPENDRRLDPMHWADLIRKHNVTVWNSVPALAGLLIDYLEDCDDSLRSVRWMLLSGDWIPLSLPERANHRFEHAELLSLGGATEASIWSILYPINEVEPSWTSIPYGKALKNQSIYVLNYQLENCPEWVTGEIYIGGIGLALGYLDDAELTRQAFITHPRTHQRLYKTGDLGRRLPDGNFEIMGRTDFQVKIQGHRIELAEIESVLMEMPEVKSAVVVASGTKTGEKRLIGYVVFAHETDPDIERLRMHLRTRVPYYMVPSVIVGLDKLPLTTNGKIDRAKLSQTTAPEPSREHIEPRDEWEKRVQQLWCDLLGQDSIGIHEHFASVGGDSMSAVRLMTSMHREFGYALTLKEVFGLQTIEEQARRIASVSSGLSTAI